MNMEELVEGELSKKTEVLEEICPSATLITKDPTYPYLESNHCAEVGTRLLLPKLFMKYYY
jgi:hypothetical protein